MNRNLLRGYLLLILIGGILTAWALTLIPAESENAILAGFSLERIFLVGGTLLISLISGTLLAISWIQPGWFATLSKRIFDWMQPEKRWNTLLIASLSITLIGAFILSLTPEITEPYTQAYFVRLKPLTMWATFISVETLAVLLISRFGIDIQVWKELSRKGMGIAILFSLFLSLSLFVAITRLGLDPSDTGAGWNFLGAPLLETQVFMVWGASLVLLGLGIWLTRLEKRISLLRNLQGVRMDILISVVIWGATSALWNSVPLEPSWFVAPPRPPNFEYYPNSDASLYDTTGQSTLVGEGFSTKGTVVAVRPMYAFFLTMLHQIQGVDYEPIISLHVATLALFPVVIYWLAKLLHNRLTGLIAAALITFREANAIRLTDEITVSNSKTLMADLPTALGVALFILIVTIWLKKEKQKGGLPLIVGGALGALMLIRPETGILLPASGLVSLIVLIRRPLFWVKSMVLIVVGLGLVMTPWIWRNWNLTGRIFLDSPHYRADLFAQRYTGDIETAKETTQMEAGETVDQFTERMTEDAVDFVRQNPDKVSYFIANHFFNSQVQSVLMLPMTFRLFDSAVEFTGHRASGQFLAECCSSEDYVRRLPFWHQWEGNFPQQSTVPLLIAFFLLAVGMIKTWKENRFIGLLPFISAFLYFGVNAAVRNSGGRYLQPLDWMSVLYYSIGLAQVSVWMVASLTDHKPSGNFLVESYHNHPLHQDTSSIEQLSFFSKTNLFIAGMILVVGSSLPVAEIVYPQRYPATMHQERLTALLQPETSPFATEEIQSIQTLLGSGGKFYLGRAIYPRFHHAGLGEMGSTWPSFYPRPYDRVSFYLLGPRSTGVILPTETRPMKFPNGADVFVIGCQRKQYFDALFVVVDANQSSPLIVLKRLPRTEIPTCPLDPPG